MNHTVEELKSEIVEKVKETRSLAMQKFNMELFPISLSFELKGGTAGQAIREGKSYSIRFNLEYADDNLSAFLSDTVVHEVAHIVDMILNGSSSHGYPWKGIMHSLGAIPTRCVQYENSVEVQRRDRPNLYTCQCGKKYHLTNAMHNSILNGQVRVCKMGHRVWFLGKEVPQI